MEWPIQGYRPKILEGSIIPARSMKAIAQPITTAMVMRLTNKDIPITRNVP